MQVTECNNSVCISRCLDDWSIIYVKHWILIISKTYLWLVPILKFLLSQFSRAHSNILGISVLGCTVQEPAMHILARDTLSCDIL